MSTSPNQDQYSQDREITISQLSDQENNNTTQQSTNNLHPKKIKKLSFFISVLTIMKSMIGVGMLGLPYVVSQFGWLFGSILFLITAILNQYSCILLIKSKNISRKSNYSSIGNYIICSKIFLFLLHAIVVFHNFGICVAGLQIFKDIFTQILQEGLVNFAYFNNWWIISIFFCIAMLPFSIVKKIQNLSIFSFVGILSIVAFLILLVANFFDIMIKTNWVLNPSIRALPIPGNFWNSLSNISNIMLAFQYQFNFFSIYKGIQNSNDKKMLSASFIATVLTLVIYLAIGILGYLSYGDFLSSNYLLSVSDSNFLSFSIKISFIISVICTFPIMFFGARNNFIDIIKLFLNKREKFEIGKKKKNDYSLSKTIQANKRTQKLQIQFYVLTLFLYSLIFIMSIRGGDLKKILNLVGGIAANSIAFLLPSLFYLLLIIKQKKRKNFHFICSLMVSCLSLPLIVKVITTSIQ